jgi:origin recognition complex subunit 5
MRLTKLFVPSITAALQSLYPRLTNASSWARENAPEPSLLDLPLARPSSSKNKTNATGSKGSDGLTTDVLPRMSKFILVAAFLASTNPAKTDLKMFGRGVDERKKKRRKGGGPRKVHGKTTVAKVSTRVSTFSAYKCHGLIWIIRFRNDCWVLPRFLLTDYSPSLVCCWRKMMSIRDPALRSSPFLENTLIWKSVGCRYMRQ